MNRKALLIGLPVTLLLLFAAVSVFLLAEDTETDSIIGRSDTQTEAESGKSDSKLPDACSGNSSDGGDNSKAHSKGRDSKTDVDVETLPPSEPDAGLETALDTDPKQAVDGMTQEEHDKAFEEILKNIRHPKPPPRTNPLLEKGKAKRQNVGNRRPRAHKISKGVGVKKLKVATKKLKQDRRGLFAKYYRFNADPISVLIDPANPDLDDRRPDIVRIDRQVSFPNKEAWDDLPFDKSNFMAVWTGFLVIEKAADYWLFLGCDLHGRVELDGQTILLNQVRDYSEVTTVVKLKAGLHPLRIEYVEGKNGSVVEELGSCNFMWVPEGKSKPEPVPAEMLLLPEALWDDRAPIITRLSQTHGAIGDMITVHGQGFDGNSTTNTEIRIEVVVSGYNAKVIESSASSLKIRIPIGAKTGKIMVTKVRVLTEPDPDNTHLTNEVDSWPTPSNSVDFTVTNQFGLIANWHNLEGWSHFDFIEPGVREPEVTQLENPPTFESREDLNLEFKQNPTACTWTGKLGNPTNWHYPDARQFVLRFESHGRLRVKLGEEIRTSAAMNGETGNQTALDFELTRGEDERYLPLQIDWVNEGGPASFSVSLYATSGGGENESMGFPWEFVEYVSANLFFPPVVPDTAPTISSIHPVVDENEEPLELPYALNEGITSIREGQECKMFVRVNSIYYSKTDMKSAVITIDGKRVEYEFVGERSSRKSGKTYQYNFTLPSGLGEGRVHIRANVLTSPPFVIDIQNKGLIAYYYDLPNAGGYQSMPDLEPLACFAIRKDRWINYENANDFKLPFPAETFAIQWLGAIIIEEDGFYTFTTRSDDGSKVWLDGNVVVDANNLQYQRERSGEPVFLAAGTYTFKMEFFENNGLETCELMWQAKDNQDNTIIEKQTVPKRAFTWDAHPALPSKQATGKRADGSDPE